MKIVLKANQVWESKEKGGLTLKIIGHFHVFSVGNKKDVRYAGVEKCIDKIKEFSKFDEEGFNDAILNSLYDKCKNYKENYNSIVTKINELQRVANELKKNNE